MRVLTTNPNKKFKTTSKLLSPRVHGFCSNIYYSDVQSLGLLCNVDLFPVPAQPDSSSESGSLTRLHHPHQLPPVVEPIRPPSGSHPLPSILSTDQLPPLSSSSRVPVSGTKLPHLPPYAHFDPFQISENMKYTMALSGATFVQPACIDYEGKRALVFPFAVRLSS
jgi:hypothetical protein